MTQIFDETFQGGANGVAITTANSAFTTLVESGWTFSTTQFVQSTQSGRNIASGTSVIASTDFPAMSAGWLRFYLYVQARPPGSNISIAQMRAGSTIRAELQLGPNGELRMKDSTLSVIHTTPNETTPTGSWVRIEWKYDNSAARQRVRVYTGSNRDQLTPDYDSGEVVTIAAGTITRLAVGTCNATTMTTYWDSVNLDSTAFAAPLSNTTPPTANAGVDQIVEPGQLVTLTGSDTAGGLTRTWTQTAGSPTVTLSGTGQTRIFTAPPTASGTTLTFRYSVSNAGGTAQDTMTVQVRESSDFIAVGGVWVPAYWEML